MHEAPGSTPQTQAAASDFSNLESAFCVDQVNAGNVEKHTRDEDVG